MARRAPAIATALLCTVAVLAPISGARALDAYFRLAHPPGTGPAAPGATGNALPPTTSPVQGPGTTPPPAQGNGEEGSTQRMLSVMGVDATSSRSADVPLTASFALVNGTAPITYAVVSGSPPPEMSVTRDGTFTGTPRTAGRYAFVVRGTDATQASADLPMSMTVVPQVPQITVHMPDGPIFAGTAFAAPISVDNGVEVTDFTFIDTPPAFLTILGNEMRGAPAAGDAGYQYYSVQGNDPYGQSGPTFGLFEVLVPSLSLNGVPSRVRAGVPFSGTVDTNVPDGAFALSSAPAGVTGTVTDATLSASTPAAAAETPYSLTLSRTRQDGTTATASAALVAVPPLSASGGVAVLARVGRALTAVPTPAASNLLDPGRAAAWSLGAGTLPTGVTVDPVSGGLTGTPGDGTQGDYPNVRALATDPADSTTAAAAPFAVKVLGPLTFQGIPATVTLTRGRSYSASPSFLNNTGSGEVTAANLPANLVLSPGSATPTLTGAPSASGTSVSRFSVTDPTDGAPGAFDVTFQVVDPVTATASSTSVRRTSSVSYAPALTGQGPFTSRLVSGSLPANLQVDPATLRVTGTPTATGSSTATYEVTDATGAVGTVPITVTVTAAPTAAAGTLAGFRIGSTRTAAQTIVPTGVATPSWSSQGTWPAWLSIDPATGAMTGSPTAAYASTLTARVTDLADQAYATATLPVSAVGNLLATGTASYVTDNSQDRSTSYNATNALGTVRVGAANYPGVVWSAEPPLPSAFTLGPDGILKLKANTTGEWDGRIVATDLADGQVSSFATLISYAAQLTLSNTYQEIPTKGGGYDFGSLANGNAFRFGPTSAPAGGVPPYRIEFVYGNNGYGVASGTVSDTPPFGAIEPTTGVWSGTLSTPTGATAFLNGTIRLRDSRGRKADASLGFYVYERTAERVCVQGKGTNANRQVVYTDATGLKADNFYFNWTNVFTNAGTRTGNGTLRLAAYPSIDGNGVPSGTPTVVAQANFYNTGYDQTVVGSPSKVTANVTSKVWALEAIPANGETRPLPAFSAAYGFNNTSASGCTY